MMPLTQLLFTPVFNHLWQSTLFAAAAAVLTLALRRNSAQVRYWVWLAASVKFLLPFALLVNASSHFASRSGSPLVPPTLTVVMDQISRPFAPPNVAVSPHATAFPFVPATLAGIWLLGCFLVLGNWLRQLRRIRAAMRLARPVHLETDPPIRAVASPVLLEPGVFGVFRPTLILPEGIRDHLTSEQLEAILAHEQCHVRRWDNLTAALHMVVEALFWFHPLVWWLGSRLIEERERACDEEVLRLGREPRVYAESILRTSRFCLESPLACMAGVTGSDLKRRIERIMDCAIGDHALVHKIGFATKALLGAFLLASVGVPVAIGMLHSPQIEAGFRLDAGDHLAFELASIRPHHSAPAEEREHRSRRMMQILPGSLILHNLNLRDCLQWAYGISNYQISGPSWINTETYDISAKAAGPAHEQQLRLMLRALLSERFGLALHQETKNLTVYALVVDKGGPKFAESTLAVSTVDSPGFQHRISIGPILSLQRASTRSLADTLSTLAIIDRPVIDNTGLRGLYDFDLDLAEVTGRAPDASTPGPSIFTVLKEQLGLKLEPRKAELEILVVDRGSKLPIAN